MNKLFENKPKYENSKYRLRLIHKKDLNQLLELYSNKENLENVNVDDCNGDDFYCDNIEKMNKKFKFWNFAYENKWFVRMAIYYKQDKKIIGTLELLKRKGYDSYKDSIVIRLDLLISYEKKQIIKDILNIVENNIVSECIYSKLVIKATPFMVERKEALQELEFKLSNRIMIGMEDNKEYKHYYVKNKN